MKVFSHFTRLVTVLSMTALFLLTSCDMEHMGIFMSDPNPDDDGSDGTMVDEPPVLKNLVVHFDVWEQSSNQAGDFLFDETEEKVFLEFGAEVTGPDGPKILPTFEYRVDVSTDLQVPCDGIITDTLYQQETGDYEVWIQPTEESAWTVIIDHVTELKYFPGMRVIAGDILGKPGPWSTLLGRVELMVFNMNDGRAYAPFSVFDPNLAPEYESRVWQLMSEWEAFKNDTTLYDEAAMETYWAGCLAESYQDG